MAPTVLALLGGLLLLTGGATALVRGAASLALRIGLTPLVVGLTVVAFGTSAPELVVSAGAALDGAGGIAVGNVVGSNIANVGLILAVAALIRPIETERAMLRRDLPLMLAASALGAAFLWDGRLGRPEGAVRVVLLVAYVAWSVRQSRAEARAAAAARAAEGVPAAPDGAVWQNALLVAGGLGALVVGAQWLVASAVTLAQAGGVSNAVIGLTVVAIGTSLPELATSTVAAARGESAIAAGNVVGSNLFNVLGVLGVAALVQPLHAPGLQRQDLLVMLAFGAVLVPMMLSGRRLGRSEAGVLLAGYAGYMAYLADSHG